MEWIIKQTYIYICTDLTLRNSLVSVRIGGIKIDHKWKWEKDGEMNFEGWIDAHDSK